jgi:hypothetical protein
MEKIIKELNLNMDAQVAGFRERWTSSRGGSSHSTGQAQEHCFVFHEAL